MPFVHWFLFLSSLSCLSFIPCWVFSELKSPILCHINHILPFLYIYFLEMLHFLSFVTLVICCALNYFSAWTVVEMKIRHVFDTSLYSRLICRNLCFLVGGAETQASMFSYLHCWGFQDLCGTHSVFPEEVVSPLQPSHFSLRASFLWVEVVGCGSCVCSHYHLPGKQKPLTKPLWVYLAASTTTSLMGGGGVVLESEITHPQLCYHRGLGHNGYSPLGWKVVFSILSVPNRPGCSNRVGGFPNLWNPCLVPVGCRTLQSLHCFPDPNPGPSRSVCQTPRSNYWSLPLWFPQWGFYSNP